jgi:hypothetical protein
MHLLRSIVAQFGNGESLTGVKAQLENVTVYSTHPIQLAGKPLGIVVVASLPLSISLPEGDNSFVIPVEPRRKAEAILEIVTQLLAIDKQTSHSISSPMPFIGFTSDDPETMSLLDGRTVNQNVMSGRLGARTNLDLFSDFSLRVLSDRLDGVALLSEALNSNTSLGRYMQLIRLFERAFKRGPTSLTEPLVELLQPSPYGITEGGSLLDGCAGVEHPR